MTDSNWTNTHNLPECIVKTLKYSDYDKGDADYSISDLLRPPQATQLVKRHADSITRDVSDMLWMFLGSSVHDYIAKTVANDVLSEERLFFEMSGLKITAKPDLFEPDGTLTDFKVTSVYAFLLGDKPEWEQQLNCYAYAYGKMGFEVKSLRIVAILRDYMASKAQHDPQYPQCPVHVVNVPLWDKHKQFLFLQERISAHVVAETKSDEELPRCTSSERWEKPDSWAAIKKGNKRATKVLYDQQEAIQFAQQKGLQLEYRKGTSMRCERYCDASAFCHQYGGNDRVQTTDQVFSL